MKPHALGPLGWLTAFVGAVVASYWAVVVLLLKANAWLASSNDICRPPSFRGAASAGWEWRVDWFPTETVCWPRGRPDAAFVASSHASLTTNAIIALCLISLGLGLVVAGHKRRRQHTS